MKIAFMHMTMGIEDRGSEVSTKLIATSLARKHEVLVLQAGPVDESLYQAKRVMRLKNLPPAEPVNLLQKIKHRLYLDQGSRLVKLFTNNCLSEIQKFQPDIIVPVNGAAQVKIIQAHFPKTKMVVFGRAGIGYHDKDTLRREPDLFIALSKTALTWAKYQAKGLRTRLAYVPNPFDPKLFYKAKPQSINLPRPLILSVGSLSAYKNIDLVIEAVSLTNASLLILGDGQKHAALEAMAKTLLPGRHLIKKVKNQDIGGYYKAADVFCFVPDPQESFGRVYLEAMSANLPIVTCDDEIRRKIVGKNGYYTTYEIDDISSKIIRALGKKPVNYTAELSTFDLTAVTTKIEQLCMSL